MSPIARIPHGYRFALLTVAAALTVSVSCAQRKNALGSTVAAEQGGGEFYTVTHFAPYDWAYECRPNDVSIDPDFGVAVTENSAFFPGTCPDHWDPSGHNIPDCSAAAGFHDTCGKSVLFSYQGRTERAYISGLCPEHHYNNAQKGGDNPCLRGRNHLDVSDKLYFAMGLTDNESYGSGGQRVVKLTADNGTWSATKAQPSPPPPSPAAPSAQSGDAAVGGYSCVQQKAWGQCGQAWMAPTCDVVCRGDANIGGWSCQQHKDWGNCGKDWMHPSCDAVCNGQANIGGWSCDQHKSWGNCGKEWMHPTCDSACGNPALPSSPSAGSGDSWKDPYSATTFPYCTNGSNTGSGFGWQPQLGGPNGGSCKAR